MTKLTLTLAGAFALATFLPAQITPGNLVVTRVGDGVNALSSASTAMYLDEYTRAGTFVQSIPLPTTATGNQWPLTNSGSATSEGSLTQSVDNRYFVMVGYGAVPGTPSIVSTLSNAVPRIAARIGLDGAIDTSTALADAYSGNNIRSACSLDGNQFWTAGTSTTTNGPGVRFVANLGDTTSLQLSTSVINIRRVDVVDGQLYCVTQSGSNVGVNLVGAGVPTSIGQTISLLPGFPSGSASPYDFFFADASTVYVTDDRTNGQGGIQKWAESGGAWTLQYTLAPAVNVGCRGLSGYVDGGNIVLFATTTSNVLVTGVDAGAASTFTTLASPGVNTAFRSVRFVRAAPGLVHSGSACATTVGAPGLGTSGGVPLTGNLAFQLEASNTPASTFVLFALHIGPVSPIGFPVPGAPACALVYLLPDVLVAAIANPFGAASMLLPIPPGALLGGTKIATQLAVFDFALPGFALPIGTSDALEITIGN